MQFRPTSFKLSFTVLMVAMLCISACENDLNKVKAIAAADATKPIQRTTDVDLIYSDSAKVKFKITSPLLLEFTQKDPTKSYKQLPHGVKVVFFNPQLTEDGNIIADTAYMRNEDKLVEFHKNVVARNNEGSVYKSEELIYDRANAKIYSNKFVEMTKVNGDIYRGSSFVSDDKMKHPIFQNSTAVIHVNGDNLAQ